VPVPESHRRELARRRAAHHDNPSAVRSWEEVRKRLWSED
jgi:putative addiction module component (TIGR02574 family)